MDEANTQITVESAGHAIGAIRRRYEKVRLSLERDYQGGKMDRRVRNKCFALSAKNEAAELAPYRAALLRSEMTIYEPGDPA